MNGRAPCRVAFCVAMLAMSLATPAATAAPKKHPPPAQDVRREKVARGHFQKAEEAFNLGKFREALLGYESAYAAMPLPPFLFNIAQCHRNIGNHERAVFFYQRYLALEPEPPNRKIVDDLIAEEQKQRIQEDAAAVAAIAATAPPVQAPPAQASDLAPVFAAPTVTPVLQPERSRTDLLTRAAPVQEHEPEAVYRKPWFWGTVAMVALAGGVAALFMRRGDPSPTGDLGTIDARLPPK